MKTSRTLLASIFLTAVILAVVGGFATKAMAQKRAETVAPTEDLSVYQEREAAYRQTIEQANQQLQALQDRVVQLEGQPLNNTENTAAPVAAVSAEQALQIAQEAAGTAPRDNNLPELVSFEGKAAYEVIFEAGSIYVDAQTGQVLFNGTVPQEITADQAAQIASEYLGIQGVLSVDQISFRGAALWRVIFKNSTIAYLDRTGQITYVLKDSNKSTIVQVDDDDNSGGGSYSGSYDHEDDDDHEEHEHEDD